MYSVMPKCITAALWGFGAAGLFGGLFAVLLADLFNGGLQIC